MHTQSTHAHTNAHSSMLTHRLFVRSSASPSASSVALLVLLPLPNRMRPVLKEGSFGSLAAPAAEREEAEPDRTNSWPVVRRHSQKRGRGGGVIAGIGGAVVAVFNGGITKSN